MRNRKTEYICTQADLEERAARLGILPFFRNNIPGFSVEEMVAPGMLFGGNEFEGAWEWKGPVIRNRTTAYGKFFRRKAGFVSLDLLPLFLAYRRKSLPIKENSLDEMIYEIICVNDKITSTELRRLIKGTPKKRQAHDLPELGAPAISPSFVQEAPALRRSALEGPLQRLQMGGWICISDFQYKTTRRGERYGWGVAEYSTPEMLFDLPQLPDLQPEECLRGIISEIETRFPAATSASLHKLLKP